MCTVIVLPDGQEIESRAALAELVSTRAGTPGPWADTDHCLCGVDVHAVLASIGLVGGSERAFEVHVPGQPDYPARYCCVDGPAAGTAIRRKWGLDPWTTVVTRDLDCGGGSGARDTETEYRLDGDCYRLVYTGPRRDTPSH